jgi:hypothetical protein
MHSVLTKTTAYHQLLELLWYLTMNLLLTRVLNILRLYVHILKKKNAILDDRLTVHRTITLVNFQHDAKKSLFIYIQYIY